MFLISELILALSFSRRDEIVSKLSQYRTVCFFFEKRLDIVVLHSSMSSCSNCCLDNDSIPFVIR
jgi:hypothetical protein